MSKLNHNYIVYAWGGLCPFFGCWAVWPEIVNFQASCAKTVSHMKLHNKKIFETHLWFWIYYFNSVVISNCTALSCNSSLGYVSGLVLALSEFADVSMLQEPVACCRLYLIVGSKDWLSSLISYLHLCNLHTFLNWFVFALLNHLCSVYSTVLR